MILDEVELENGTTLRRQGVAAAEILREHLKDHPLDHG